MTDEQIAQLMELQKLHEEGILNKDDLVKEKAKILGEVDKTETKIQSTEPQVSEPLKVVQTEETQPVTLKIKVSKDENLQMTETTKTESQVVPLVSKIPEVESNTKNSQQIEPQNSTDTKNAKETSKTIFQKFKIPIFVAVGVLFLWGGFSIAKRYKYVFSKNNESTFVEEAHTYEDKFEHLWAIGSTRDYTEDDFAGWSKEDLKILRNYFFAKNNYYFGSKDWRDYFSKYTWYHATYKDVGDLFSDLQTNNVQFIKKLEGLNNYYKEH